MRFRRPGILRRPRAALLHATDLRFWLRPRALRLVLVRDRDYRAYLTTQLGRTLSKRDNDPGIGLRVLVDRASAGVPRSASVLCVGCRNGIELDEFRRRGFRDVVGVDLFSQRRDILVMDMHDMSFRADSFDVVFSSHSLEHAYDLDVVVAELARVGKDGAVIAVEVPVRASSHPADRLRFEDAAMVRSAFGSHVREELWVDEQPPRTASNGQGTDVARLVFRLRKDRAPAPGPVPARSAASIGSAYARLAVTAAILLALLVVALPEELGDRPYNVF